jgi:hypothetical protein
MLRRDPRFQGGEVPTIRLSGCVNKAGLALPSSRILPLHPQQTTTSWSPASVTAGTNTKQILKKMSRNHSSKDYRKFPKRKSYSKSPQILQRRPLKVPITVRPHLRDPAVMEATRSTGSNRRIDSASLQHRRLPVLPRPGKLLLQQAGLNKVLASWRLWLWTTRIQRLPPNHRDYTPEGPRSVAELLTNETSNRTTKKALSVDSPAFTPATLSVPGKTSTISSQAANAAPFTPRGLASGKPTPRLDLLTMLIGEGTVTPIPQTETEPATFNPAQIKEFTPQQNYDMSTNVSLVLFTVSRSC